MRFQRDSFSCGVFAVKNALEVLGSRVSERRIRAHSATTKEHGTNEHGILSSLDRVGFSGEVLAHADWDDLKERLCEGSPVILLLDRGQHWATAFGVVGDRVCLFDSGRAKVNKRENGVHVLTRRQLLRRWSEFKDQGRFGVVVKLS